jgi:hypothetical protein
MNTTLLWHTCISCALLFSITTAHADKKPACSPAVAETLSRSVVSIARTLDASEVRTDPKTGERITSIRASAWLYRDRQTLVTIEHAAEEMGLKRDVWKDITIAWSATEYESPHFFFEMRAMLLDTDDDSADAPVRIMLEDELPQRLIPAQLREGPLKDNDPVVAVGYTHGVLRFATGKLNFPEPSQDAELEEKPSPYLPFELANNNTNDRLAMDHGASGGPITDCDGKVAAVFVEVLTQDQEVSNAISSMMRILETFGSPEVDTRKERDALGRISSSWGEHNAHGAVTTFPSP